MLFPPFDNSVPVTCEHWTRRGVGDKGALFREDASRKFLIKRIVSVPAASDEPLLRSVANQLSPVPESGEGQPGSRVHYSFPFVVRI